MEKDTTPLPVSESVTYGPVSDSVIIKGKDHFYITVAGVPGISLRVDSPTIPHAELKVKAFTFFTNLMRHLG